MDSKETIKVLLRDELQINLPNEYLTQIIQIVKQDQKISNGLFQEVLDRVCHLTMQKNCIQNVLSDAYEEKAMEILRGANLLSKQQQLEVEMAKYLHGRNNLLTAV